MSPGMRLINVDINEEEAQSATLKHNKIVSLANT